MSIYIGDKEIKNLYAGGSISISDMQGPCPDGFHVPLSSEWVALYGVLTTTFSMAATDTTMGTYLKMPMAGYRYYSSASVNSVGSYGRYWSSTPYDAIYAYSLDFYSSYVNPQNSNFRSYGFSVRCFKDSPVIPTSSWTTLYQGTGSAGIFWNSVDGLISVSGDGQTWYTIQDKNLGATIVFNQGDTLTDANCGYFYQRGNNYGFAHSGTVTTSSTQVDASNYGPGNYYSDSKFQVGYYSWDYSNNQNLWGGVTQGTTETGAAKAVYLGDTKVRPSIIPITTPGIYWNSELGLISLSSDGTNWTTIADKNLGATSTDITSTDSYGNYYQRGNNYGFPNSGTVTTSSTTVNAGSYGPNNYYNNSTFRTGSYWDTSYNANLWGDTTNTNAARKGPCDTGYHIPSQSEALALINLGVALGAWTSSGGDNMKNILFMPYGGTMSTSGSVGAQGLYGYYWTSTKYSNNNGYCIEFYSSVNHIGNAAKTYGMKIRPFKNEAVQPDKSRTKLN